MTSQARASMRYRPNLSDEEPLFSASTVEGDLRIGSSLSAGGSGRPAPILHLGQVLAVLADIELVLLHRAPVALGRFRHLVREPRNAADGVKRELVAVEVVQYRHVERGRRRAFFLVAA